MLRHLKRIWKGPPKPSVYFSPSRITSPPNFFNRTKEAEFFTKRLNQEMGQLFVVTGPPNCGKTALLSKVLSDDPNRRCILWDLRLAQWGSFSKLYKSMSRESSYSVSGGTIKAKAYPDPSLSSHLSFEHVEKPASADFHSVLRQLSDHLIAGSGDGRKLPVFWIDEANYLKAYSKEGGCDAESDNALQSLLAWCVEHSKQTSHFHVILSSSESLFFNYLSLRGQAQFCTPLTILDPSKEEAQKYFELLVSKLPASLASQAPDFNHVYSVLGGRIPRLVDYVDTAFATGSFDDGLLSDPVLEAIETFTWALTPSEFRADKDSVAKYGVPEWTRSDLLKAMDLLISHDGCVPAAVMGDQVPRAAMQSLVSHNLFCFLPNLRGVPDLKTQTRGPVYIPTFPEHLCAMKSVITAHQAK